MVLLRPSDDDDDAAAKPAAVASRHQSAATGRAAFYLASVQTDGHTTYSTSCFYMYDAVCPMEHELVSVYANCKF